MTTAAPTEADLTAAIHAEIAVFRQSVPGGVKAINDGPCAAFAEAVRIRLGSDPRFRIIRTGELWGTSPMTGAHRAGSKLIRRVSPASTPPAPLSWSDLDTLGLGQDMHCWILFQGRHYDAEAPDGVDSLFDLPFFRCALVDRVMRIQPRRIRKLLGMPWWRRSFEMDHELQLWAASLGLIARVPQPVWETVAYKNQGRGRLAALLACVAGSASLSAGRIQASSPGAIFKASRQAARYGSS